MADSNSPVIDWEALEKNPEYEVARICTVNTADIEGALEKHAAIYAYANASYAQARSNLAKAEWKYEQEKAKVFGELREQGTAIGEAKETADTYPQVKEAKQAVLEADRLVRILYALVQGLESRQSMLVQLSARQRAELNNSY